MGDGGCGGCGGGDGGSGGGGGGAGSDLFQPFAGRGELTPRFRCVSAVLLVAFVGLVLYLAIRFS